MTQITVTNEPQISIIVANYNNEKFISDCLDSILCQSLNDYEIIIADDNSRDGSVKHMFIGS